jgi:hypothetical protein
LECSKNSFGKAKIFFITIASKCKNIGWIIYETSGKPEIEEWIGIKNYLVEVLIQKLLL